MSEVMFFCGRAYVFARLRHDDVLRRLKDMPVYPETVPFYEFPRSSGRGIKGKPVLLSLQWLRRLWALNDRRAFRWLLAPHSAWCNRPWRDGAPLVETLSFGGNVVQVLGIGAGWAAIAVLDAPPPAWAKFDNAPWMVQRVICRGPKGEYLYPASGLECYMFPLGRQKVMYIPLKRLELFPALPYKAHLEGVDICEKPRGGVAYGNVRGEVNITAYMPMGTDVWGRCNAGSVPLLICDNSGPNYLTDWQMTTRPPLPD